MRVRPKLPNCFREVQRGKCRWCGGVIIENGKVNTRKTWHTKCVEEYKIHTDAGTARRAVYKRDNGICQCCKLDLKALEAEMRQTWRDMHRDRKLLEDKQDWLASVESAKLKWAGIVAKMTALGFGANHISFRRELWDSDHIEPVWKSQGELRFFSLDNQQLLCVPCHACKTREDVKAYKESRSRKGREVDSPPGTA